MPDYLKEYKRVTLNLSRNTARKLLNGLDLLLEIGVKDSEAYSAIRCLIQVQLDDHDAKEVTT